MLYPSLLSVKFSDIWNVLKFALEDRPMIMRIRSDLESLSGHPEFGNRLRIVWEYECDNDIGLPNNYDLSKINECDDLLGNALEADNHAILAYVSTCDGLRQWVFYISDIEESARRIDNVLPQDPPY
jgi:hypothetical protein